MSADISEIENRIRALLPNREQIRFYIWNELKGPINNRLDQFLKSKVEDYGSWKEKYRGNGRLAYQGWIYRERKQGHWRYFYKSGKPHKECYYKNNQLHGICTVWKVNGSRETAEYYKGKRNGALLRFDSEGVLFQKHIYEMGKAKSFLGPVELGYYDEP